MSGSKLQLILVPFAIVGLASAAFASDYVGSEACFRCHSEQYNEFRTSGHPYKLRPVFQAKQAPVPLPKGYTWNDISYVIGGFRWKSRYVNKEGYIITTDKKGDPIPTQWNIQSGKWVNYHPGEKKPYNCGKCHTTGYSEEGHQDGLEGIVGTWAFPGIQCEECHGPGGDHIRNGNPAKIKKITESGLCAKCHIRGEKDKIPAKGGFIRHHEQYNEYLASLHSGELECTSRHNPHKPARFGIDVTCVECHDGPSGDYEGSKMEQAGVECIDCHMPRASKSAEQLGFKQGDVRTHNWKISIDPNASLVTPDGKFATGVVTLDFVCLQCHQGRDVKWAAQYAKGVHRFGKQP